MIDDDLRGLVCRHEIHLTGSVLQRYGRSRLELIFAGDDALIDFLERNVFDLSGCRVVKFRHLFVSCLRGLELTPHVCS